MEEEYQATTLFANRYFLKCLGMISITYMAFFTINYTHLFVELFGFNFWPSQHSLAYLSLEGAEKQYYKHLPHLLHRESDFVEFVKTTEMMSKDL